MTGKTLTKRVTVIADSSKLGRTALFRVCGLDQINRLVVDLSPNEELSAALAVAGVEVLVPSPLKGT